MWLMKNSPVWAPEDEGGAAPAADAVVDAPADAKPDAASTMYPDDKPAGADAAPPVVDGDVKTPTDGTDDATKPAADDADDNAAADGEWKEYVADPAKSDEENAAAKLENDLKHPVNQVPEDGKYSLTMPEGVELDQGLLDALGGTMSELKLSNGHAQMLADKFIEAQQAKADEAAGRWSETITGWLDEAKKDPDMGGAKWDGTVRDASSVVSRFGTPELKEYLEASGAGNHPEIIRLMAKVGSMIAEDKPAISESPGGGTAAPAEVRLYPDDKPKG